MKGNAREKQKATVYTGLLFVVMTMLISGAIYLIFTRPVMLLNALFVLFQILFAVSVTVAISNFMIHLYKDIRTIIYEKLIK